jgi:transposase
MGFVLGPALSRKALPGGKAKHDKIDAHQIAVVLRGAMGPQAYVSPAERRTPRALLRRRCPVGRKRAELWAHLQTTHSPDNLPELGTKLADKAHRAGGAEHVPAPRGRKTLEVDIALLAPDDHVLGAVARSLTRPATAHAGQTFSRLQSGPGIGQSLALLLLYAIQDSARFPRVPDFVSYGRVVQCAQESGGKRLGPSGEKLGTVPLRWAVAEAAVVFLYHTQPGTTYFAKCAPNHGKATALTVLAPQLGRAVYSRLTREHAFELSPFVPP